MIFSPRVSLLARGAPALILPRAGGIFTKTDRMSSPCLGCGRVQHLYDIGILYRRRYGVNYA